MKPVKNCGFPPRTIGVAAGYLPRYWEGVTCAPCKEGLT
jgi:hypothetical protein